MRPEEPSVSQPEAVGTMVKNEYRAEQIQILEGLEAVRKRPAMYIGNTSSAGLHHLVYEIVDNAVDEALAGHCSAVSVTLNRDGSVTITDNGRGIPVGIQKKTGLSALQVVFTVLHAGGKFDSSNYKVSGGLHGVGASVVNALSLWLRVEVRRDGGTWKQSYSRGVPDGAVTKEEAVRGCATGPLARQDDPIPLARQDDPVPSARNEAPFSPARQGALDTVPVSGTTVTFLPDPEIFRDPVFQYEVLKKRMRETAFLTKGLSLTLTDLRADCKHGSNTAATPDAATADAPKSPESPILPQPMLPRQDHFLCEKGLEDFVNWLNRDASPLYSEIICGSADSGDIQVEFAIQHTAGYDQRLYSFVNNISTPEGGSHVTGFHSALVRALNHCARNLKLLKESAPPLCREELTEGLTAVISVRMQDPQFEGQTKQKLGSSQARPAVDSLVYHRMILFLEQHPDAAKAICSKAMLARKAKDAAKSARDLARRKTALSGLTLPGKLADCSGRNPESCELFIVEGDSAGGSAKAARCRENQAVLPLRGKILNVEKAAMDKISSNAEIKAMISAFGTGILESFSLERLRYHKIILMTDADVDGAHITTLLLTFLFRFMPELIRSGHIFLAQPPLYRVEKGRKLWYAYSDAQLSRILDENERDGTYKIQRYKGLGEMDAQQLWETTMDPERRVLLKVTTGGGADSDVLADTDRTFSLLMGNDVEPRRDFILANADRISMLDV